MGQLGPNAGVEIGTDLAERPVQLVMVAFVQLQRRRLLGLGVVRRLGLPGLVQGLGSGLERAPDLGPPELGPAHLLGRGLVLDAHPVERVFLEAQCVDLGPDRPVQPRGRLDPGLGLRPLLLQPVASGDLLFQLRGLLLHGPELFQPVFRLPVCLGVVGVGEDGELFADPFQLGAFPLQLGLVFLPFADGHLAPVQLLLLPLQDLL